MITASEQDKENNFLFYSAYALLSLKFCFKANRGNQFSAKLQMLWGHETKRCLVRFSCLINLFISVSVGVIVTARKFDRERQREYAVTVTATDQAADPLIGICQLNILILDQNDNSPKFENIRYECK